MTRSTTIIIAAIGAMTAAGIASQASAEQIRDVAFYVAHPDLRKATLARCDNNPGQLARTPNCVNARAAQSRAIWSSKNTGMPSLRSKPTVQDR